MENVKGKWVCVAAIIVVFMDCFCYSFCDIWSKSYYNQWTKKNPYFWFYSLPKKHSWGTYKNMTYLLFLILCVSQFFIPFWPIAILLVSFFSLSSIKTFLKFLLLLKFKLGFYFSFTVFIYYIIKLWMSWQFAPNTNMGLAKKFMIVFLDI